MLLEIQAITLNAEINTAKVTADKPHGQKHCEQVENKNENFVTGQIIHETRPPPQFQGITPSKTASTMFQIV